MPRNEKSKKSNVLKSFSKVLKKVITGGGGSSKRPMQEIYNSDMSLNRIKKKLNEHNELPTPKRNQSLHQSSREKTRLADNHSLDADYPFYEKPPTPDRSFSKVKTLRK